MEERKVSLMGDKIYRRKKIVEEKIVHRRWGEKDVAERERGKKIVDKRRHRFFFFLTCLSI